MPPVPIHKPLISIVVLTYNSSQYILETLESAYRQTYSGPMELIITDDCSTDDTASICRNWLAEKQHRFVRTELLTVPENTGVSKNINRGCRIAQGEWLKPIAGDDILMDDCLETSWQAAQRLGESCVFIAAPVYCFNKLSQLQSPGSLSIFNPEGSNKIIDLAYVCERLGFWLPAPSFFLNKKMLEDFDYFPEIFRNIEDAPMLRKVVAHGYLIHTIDIPTVYYRCSETSLTSTYLNRIRSERACIVSYNTFLKKRLSFIQRLNAFFFLLPLRVNVLFNGKFPLLVSIIFIMRNFFMKLKK